MRNTLANRLFVKNSLMKYCAIAKVRPPFDLVFEMFTIYNIREPARELHSVYYEPLLNKRDGLLFVNLSTRDDKKDVDEDIAHEVIHIKYPTLRHGPGFDKKVKELIELGNTK